MISLYLQQPNLFVGVDLDVPIRVELLVPDVGNSRVLFPCLPTWLGVPLSWSLRIEQEFNHLQCLACCLGVSEVELGSSHTVHDAEDNEHAPFVVDESGWDI